MWILRALPIVAVYLVWSLAVTTRVRSELRGDPWWFILLWLLAAPVFSLWAVWHWLFIDRDVQGGDLLL